LPQSTWNEFEDPQTDNYEQTAVYQATTRYLLLCLQHTGEMRQVIAAFSAAYAQNGGGGDAAAIFEHAIGRPLTTFETQFDQWLNTALRSPRPEPKVLQRELAQLGFLSPHDVDGVLGSHTKHALLAFQKAYGLGGGVLDRDARRARSAVWLTIETSAPVNGALPRAGFARASCHHSRYIRDEIYLVRERLFAASKLIHSRLNFRAARPPQRCSHAILLGLPVRGSSASRQEHQ
jgi:hypothetical protein